MVLNYGQKLCEGNAGNSEQQAVWKPISRKTRRTWRNGGVIYAEGEKISANYGQYFGIERYPFEVPDNSIVS